MSSFCKNFECPSDKTLINNAITELCNNNICTEEQCCITIDSEINNNIVNVEASELSPISNLEEELKPKFMTDSGDKGSRCVENLDCKSNYCKNGRCVEMEDLDPYKYSPEECKKRRSCEINVPCEDDIHCLSGYCGNEYLCADPEEEILEEEILEEEILEEGDCVDDNSTLADILSQYELDPMPCSEAVQQFGEDTLCLEIGLEEVCAQSCNYQGCAGTRAPTEPETAPPETAPPPPETGPPVEAPEYTKDSTVVGNCVDNNSVLADILSQYELDPMSCSEAVQSFGQDDFCLGFGAEEVCAQSCNYQGCVSSQSSSRSSNNSDETVESNFGTVELGFSTDEDLTEEQRETIVEVITNVYKENGVEVELEKETTEEERFTVGATVGTEILKVNKLEDDVTCSDLADISNEIESKVLDETNIVIELDKPKCISNKGPFGLEWMTFFIILGVVIFIIILIVFFMMRKGGGSGKTKPTTTKPK